MQPPNTIVCPLCNDKVDKLLYRFHLDNERVVLERIKEHYPEWAEHDGICSRCVDYYHTEIVMEQRMLPETGPYFPVKSADDFIILPTPLRLNADPRYTGKGVTICFIDSGFYPHPDLTAHRNRIKTYIDITTHQPFEITTSLNNHSGPASPLSFVRKDSFGGEGRGEVAWHGTMTSVVCAGDGFLSNGLYKGIATDADLVLIKVLDEHNRITTRNIVKALQWVLDHHREYNIRIVNMSIGDDEPVSYKQSEVDRLAEQLISEGLVIVAAVGNDENRAIKPPANSPHVIAVGGIDDNNLLEHAGMKLYHSSYGRTADELMKPELLAHAIWIAAPILPGTSEQKESEILHSLLKLQDDELLTKLPGLLADTKLDTALLQVNDVTFIREAIVSRIQTCKYISPHYMHVDGTSFAAPMVCAVIAQLFEANPGLTPSAVREALFSTAKRINGFAPERQGFGAVQPRKALLKILKREFIMKQENSPHINKAKKTIAFFMHNHCASQVSLSGSFNHWAQDILLMEPGRDGLWKIEIPMLPAGRYYYKFFVDDRMWMEDIDNPYREPDGFSGFNSILDIGPEMN
jgi:serine protease AprX